MKKVLFIINGMVKSDGKVGISGGDIRLFEILHRSKNIEKHILTTPNGLESADKLGVKYQYSHIINYVVTPGIFSNLWISILSLIKLPHSLKSFKNENVYSSCEHLYDVLPALRLKLFQKCKWYAVYHWVEEYPWNDKRGNTPFITRYLYWLNRWFSGFLIKCFSDQILAVSEPTKEKLIQIKGISETRIKSVNCGIDYNRIQKIKNKYIDEKGRGLDAVYMKRLNYGKGIIDLLEIWKNVCKENPKAKLGIIGEGSEDVLGKINDFITKNKLEKNVHLFGVVYDFEEKYRILNTAKIFILPSHEENWAIVIGEAMAIGIPVIAYDLKEITPIWKDNLFWIKKGNTSLFSKQIIKLLKNSKQRDNKSNKALSFIQDYDWEKISTNEIN